MSTIKTDDVAALAAWPDTEDDTLVYHDPEAGVLGVRGLRLRAPAGNAGDVRVRFNRDSDAHVRLSPGEVRTVNFPATALCRSLSVRGTDGDSVAVESRADGYSEAIDVQVGPVGPQGPAGAGASTVGGVAAASAAGQFVEDGASVVVTFTDYSAGHPTLIDGTSGVVTIPAGEGGMYALNVSVDCDSDFALQLERSSDNGVNWSATAVAPPGAKAMTEFVYLSAGQKVRFRVSNDSGADIILAGANGNIHHTRLAVARIL
ncbi:MAG: hypothetical protein R3F65_23620 [bacterium]